MPATRVFSRQRLIRFSDCDAAGMVFYPQYFIMCNGMVEDWFNEGLGVGYAALISQRRIGLPIIRLEAEFTAPCFLGEHVVFSLETTRVGASSIRLKVQCFGLSDSRLRMSASLVLVTTSLDTHKAIPIPPDLRSAIVTPSDQGQGARPA